MFEQSPMQLAKIDRMDAVLKLPTLPFCEFQQRIRGSAQKGQLYRLYEGHKDSQPSAWSLPEICRRRTRKRVSNLAADELEQTVRFLIRAVTSSVGYGTRGCTAHLMQVARIEGIPLGARVPTARGSASAAEHKQVFSEDLC